MNTINRISALVAGLMLIISANSFGMWNKQNPDGSYKPFLSTKDGSGIVYKYPIEVDARELLALPRNCFNWTKKIKLLSFDYSLDDPIEWFVNSDIITKFSGKDDAYETRTIKLYRPITTFKGFVIKYEVQTISYTDKYFARKCIGGSASIKSDTELSWWSKSAIGLGSAATVVAAAKLGKFISPR